MKIIILIIAVAAAVWGCSNDKEAPLTPEAETPFVMSVSPAAGDTGVALDAPVVIDFGREMDTTTITAASFSFINPSRSASIGYGTRSATLRPDSAFDWITRYVVHLTKDIADTAGRHPDSDYVWSFVTCNYPGMMPLAIGNRWEYYVLEIDTIPLPTINYYDSVSITSDTVIDDEKWYVDADGGKYINRSDGLYEVYPGFPEFRAAAWPGALGDQATYYRPVYSHMVAVDLVKMDTSVTVPAGTFKCQMYTGYFDALVVSADCVVFYSPGIGVVRSEEYRHVSIGKTKKKIAQLVAYDASYGERR